MEEYKAGTVELEEIKKTINTLKGKLTTLENKKAELEKDCKDLIAKTIYQKREEIEKSYNEVIKEAETRLKAVEKEKEIEKKKNLDKIVEQNTRGVRESNTYLNNEIKKVLKDNNLPGFVNSNFYMMLWNPTKIGDVIGVILTVIILLAIPSVLVFVVYKDALIVNYPSKFIRYIIIALIYFAFIFIFGLIWLGIEKLTKKNQSVIDKVVELRKNIEENNNDIKRITRDTENSTTSDNFDYTRLDREIETDRLEVENYRNKKKEAMDNFVNVTQDEITNKIEQDFNKEINIIIAEMENVKAELATAQTKHDELKLRMATD